MSDFVWAAGRIAEHLCDQALWHDGRCNWLARRLRPLNDGRTGVVVTPLDSSLYDGTAGIGLFLAEFAAATADAGALSASVGAIRHALQAADSAGPGLYRGRVGVAVASIRIATVAGLPEIGERGVRLAAGAGRVRDDLDILEGMAGEVLGLLALAPALGREGVASSVAQMAAHIVARGERAGEGLSWPTGRREERLANLAGYARGVAGIAVALAEAGASTGATEFLDAARAACAYERSIFDLDAGNWPDLRAHTRTGAPGPTMTTAWCHGAPGIAISRMAIRRRLGDPDLDHDAHVALAETARAVRQTLPAGGADHCLCHGLSGNADVLLEAARSLPDPDGEWMSLAHEVAERGVERYSNHDRLWPCGLGPGEEPSLMRGLAGVGYYLLRMADPDLPTVLGASGHLTGASARLHTTREAGVHV